MITKALLGVSLLALAALTAQAVEDGQGTNVVRNLRVKEGGTLWLGNSYKTNWAEMATEAAIAAATNDLNTAVNTHIVTATNDLNTTVDTHIAAATNDLNTAVDAHIASATGTLDTAIQTRVINATNDLNTAVDAHLGLKLNITDGTATNLTVDGKFAQKPGTNQSIDAVGQLINPSAPFITITGNVSNASASIDVVGAVAGQTLILQGGNGDAVKLTNGGNVVLADGVDFTFKTNATMQLIWNGLTWIEIGRVAKE